MSQMSTFIDAAKKDVEAREQERTKRSSYPPKGMHRLATNFDAETMEEIQDLMFTRRIRTYKELLTTLVKEAHQKEVKDND